MSKAITIVNATSIQSHSLARISCCA